MEYEQIESDYYKLIDFLEEFVTFEEIECLLLDADDTESFAWLLCNRIFEEFEE